MKSLNASARLNATLFFTIAAVSLPVGCKGGSDSVAPRTPDVAAGLKPVYTAGVGATSTLLGRATFIDPSDPVLKVKRITGNWHMEVQAKPGFDLAVQTINFAVGANSGWHRHPGPVFIQVTSGTMTFYESDDPTCTPVVRTVGQGYIDSGEHAHFARNESSLPAINVVTYFAPPGAALRIDQPRPGNCPF
ncbi:MAG: hypothetical protein ABIS03_01015 [Gemmatimonadaceae bacterium]